MGYAGYGNHAEDAKNDASSKLPDPKIGRVGSSQNKPGEAPPAAGPHSKPSLTNPDSTPGTGVLPDVGDRDGTDSTSS